MRITKNQLRQIIRESKNQLQESMTIDYATENLVHSREFGAVMEQLCRVVLDAWNSDDEPNMMDLSPSEVADAVSEKVNEYVYDCLMKGSF